MEMARFRIVIAALALLAGGNLAQAQTPTEPPVVTTQRINITLEQEHAIKELIKDLKIEPVASSVKLTVGDTVPQDMVLKPIPVEIGLKVPQIKSHQFVLLTDQIAIVDPKDHKVVDLINLAS
jgi:hypothetical protein